MWMYSLGRALLDTTPRATALTGTVSVSPSSALQSVLAAMTEPDPRRRASLMNLLDVSSQVLMKFFQISIPKVPLIPIAFPLISANFRRFLFKIYQYHIYA